MRDEAFIRGGIPMTKSEIRAVSLDKLELAPDSMVYDVGAGTGSVAVEAALRLPDGYVYAVEQNQEGCRLIEENKNRFQVENLAVVCGTAPEKLEGLPVPDRVFIGGSGGRIHQILDAVFEKNPGVRVVINVITLETLALVTAYVADHELEADIVCVQVSRAGLLGNHHLMQAMNPVYIVTLEQRERRQEPEPSAGGRIMLAAPSSGSGKTVLTAGLLTLLKRRGTAVVSFKCGPDFIDPMFHRYVLGIPCRNLDSFFLDEAEVKKLFLNHAQGAELSVIEGVMGYYDGIAGNTLRASSYDIARITDTPVILVLDGRSSSLSLAAQIMGFLSFQKDSRIAGVILNKTSPVMAERLRPQIEAMGLAFAGAVPLCPEARLDSRHLGLVLPQEQEDLRKKLDCLADRLETCLDLPVIQKLAGCPGEPAKPPGQKGTDFWAEAWKPSVSFMRGKDTGKEKRKRRMAVARDEAFCFFYQENLEILCRLGWELVFFSPLGDAHLPENMDGILLGGGYPENYAAQLAENETMLCDIRSAAAGGSCFILAECGGFLYLHDHLEGADGQRYRMAGVFPADGYRTEALSRFGYITLTDGQHEIRAHEFHYWESTAPGTDLLAKKPGSARTWNCMYQTKRMLAGFPHLYYPSSPEWLRRFFDGEEPA